jgi:hypothetical protein
MRSAASSLAAVEAIARSALAPGEGQVAVVADQVDLQGGVPRRAVMQVCTASGEQYVDRGDVHRARHPSASARVPSACFDAVEGDSALRQEQTLPASVAW